MLKQIWLTIFSALNKFLFGVISLGIATIYFLGRRLLLITHVLIFLYAFKHIHILDDPLTFQLIGADERKNQLRAILLLTGLIVFWFWQFVMAIWSFNWSSVDSAHDQETHNALLNPSVTSQTTLAEGKNFEPVPRHLMSLKQKIKDFEKRHFEKFNR